MQFHKKYAIPENLKNISYVLEKYCEKTPEARRDSLNVIYMNDKYIFIQERSNVEVIKFDNLFRDDK